MFSENSKISKFYLCFSTNEIKPVTELCKVSCYLKYYTLTYSGNFTRPHILFIRGNRSVFNFTISIYH